MAEMGTEEAADVRNTDSHITAIHISYPLLDHNLSGPTVTDREIISCESRTAVVWDSRKQAEGGVLPGGGEVLLSSISSIPRVDTTASLA